MFQTVAPSFRLPAWRIASPALNGWGYSSNSVIYLVHFCFKCPHFYCRLHLLSSLSSIFVYLSLLWNVSNVSWRVEAQFSTQLKHLCPHVLSALNCNSETAEPGLHCLAEPASPGQRTNKTRRSTVPPAVWQVPHMQSKASKDDATLKSSFHFWHVIITT